MRGWSKVSVVLKILEGCFYPPRCHWVVRKGRCHRWIFCMDLKLAMYHYRGTFESWKKSWGISDIDDAINVRFLRLIAIFCYSKCHKVCRNSWFSHRICILIGSTTLTSLMCKRLCVVKLWRHNQRQSAISNTSLFEMIDF